MLGAPLKYGVVCAPYHNILSPLRVHPSLSSSYRKTTTRTRAFSGSYTESSGHATYERVLRYPDGRERRIRYPVPTSEDAQKASYHVEEWQTRNAWKAARAAKQAPSRQSPASPPKQRPYPPPDEATADADAMPSSPLALLRMMTSDAHQQAAQLEAEEVLSSYEVLQGCPWPAPRPLFVLAASSRPAAAETSTAAGAAGLTHTLRTRMPLEGVESELTRVLGGKRAANGGPIITCSEMVDGVVAFESEGDAERYGEMLERARGGGGVSIARCDSHSLFRSAQDAKAVVLLLRRGAKIPAPHQLAAAVAGRTSLEEDKPQT